MRQKIVAANWKMNTYYMSGITLLSEVIPMIGDEVTADVKVIIAPPFTHLFSAMQLMNGNKKVFLGAQNCYSEDKGAYTGEISAAMLASVGVKYVIAGHSERRKYFNEDDAIISKKILQILEHNMQAIYCCGETLEQREADKYKDVVARQIETALFGLSKERMQKIIIAYEPVWAIGTGVNATPGQAQEMHAYIRSLLEKKFGGNISKEISIIYGGSVTPNNAKSLFSCPDVDGGLVGGASLVARDFVSIVKAFA
jgi:triosephosphate isomerase (TIM)